MLEFVEDELAAQGIASQEIIQNEYQLQSVDDVSVRNVITAMRLVSNIDWTEFFETVSLVDGVLGLKAPISPPSISRRGTATASPWSGWRGRSPFDEIQIASAWQSTRRPSRTAANTRERDIGFYLIGKGRRIFEEKVRLYALGPATDDADHLRLGNLGIHLCPRPW